MGEQRMTSKREIRYSLGLPNPDYRHKVYETDEVLKAIVELAIKERGGIVGNRWIYETVTGFRNYSHKRWELFKPLLMIIASKIQYKIDGEGYVISAYSPMFASKFNFYADVGRNRPVGGFMVNKA